MTEILGAEANVRLLRELARHGGELSTSSLIARTGLAQSSVREALISLRSVGIVETLGSRRAQLFRFRNSHPLASAIAHLFEAEDDRFEAILASIRSAAKQCDQIISAWIYGSVARGQDRQSSDIDVAVVTEFGQLTRVQEEIRSALRAAEEKLGFRSSIVVVDTRDVLRLSRERDPWWVGAIRHGIPIVGERPDLLETWLLQRTKRGRHVAR